MPHSRILIIEDDIDVRELLAESLLEEGFRVEVACDGRAGFEKIRGTQFDVVISDVDMPHGGARRFLMDLSSAGISVPVILMTGNTDLDEHSATSLGASVLLHKPFRVSDVVEMILRVHSQAMEVGSLLSATSKGA